MRFLIFLVPSLLLGQVSGLTMLGLSPTQALIQYEASIATVCTLDVSEFPGFSPEVFDVDTTQFSGSNAETGRVLAVWPSATSGNTVRQVRIGLRTSAIGNDGYWHSRALATDTQYYLRVTCGGGSANTSFRTTVLSGIPNEPRPVDTAAFGQSAFPEFDFSDLTKPVIDPHTGLKIYSTDPAQWSSRQSNALNFVVGGTGWTTPANATQYSTASVATTSNMNPIVLLLDWTTLHNLGTLPNGGFWPYTNFVDMGLDIYASTTGSTTLDKTINMCLTIDSQTCFSPAVPVVIPSGTLTNLGAFFGSNTSPAEYFRGWSKRIPRNLYPRAGVVNVASSGVVSYQQDAHGQNCCGTTSGGAIFNLDWTAGTKIYIAGSSPTCTGNFCTIASVQGDTQLTIAETGLMLTNAFYISMNLGIIVSKATSTGSISFNARFETAESYPTDIWSGGGSCSTIQVTSTDGITGYPCLFPAVRQDAGALYLVGTSSPVIRMISMFFAPPNGCVGADNVSCAINRAGPSGPIGNLFDASDPATFYNVVNTNAGPAGIFKIHYDAATLGWMPYTASRYVNSDLTVASSSELTWTNLTPSASGLDLRTQILAHTNWHEPSMGTASGGLLFGISGNDAILVQNVNGNQNAGCFVFAVNLTTGLLDNYVNTMDGTTQPAFHYAGCHSAFAIDGTIPAVIVGNDNLPLNSPNSAVPYYGPFQPVIQQVLLSDGITWSSTTSLVPPAGSSVNYQVCPAGLPGYLVTNGATGNNCLTWKIEEPCSSNSTAAERAHMPCPWDASKSWLNALAVGDFIKDWDLGTPGDNEGFQVVQHTVTGTGLATIVVSRDANWSYCTNTHDGSQSPGQLTHANGWHGLAVAYQSCSGNEILADMTNSVTYQINQKLYRGHNSNTTPGTRLLTWSGAGTQDQSGDDVYTLKLAAPWANLNDIVNLSTQAFKSEPAFALFNPGGFGAIQSYVDSKQIMASPYEQGFMFDWHHYNWGQGADIEVLGQPIGNTMTYTLQAGTSGVFLVANMTGTVDVKHGGVSAWAGEYQLRNVSTSVLGNQITDATTWSYCIVFHAGECRVSSTVGQVYISMPRGEIFNGESIVCWASQMNRRIPCMFSGPQQGGQALQVRVSSPDSPGRWMRTLGHLLMNNSAQYVFGRVLPTPDGKYLLFPGYETNGYHTGLMMAKLPPFPNDSRARNTYVPVTVAGTCAATCYAEFGYLEYGDGVTHFNCTQRDDNCRTATASINENVPFLFASETPATVTGPYKIVIPGISQRLMVYRIVDGGYAGPVTPVIVP
jgi:hypothetical protein